MVIGSSRGGGGVKGFEEGVQRGVVCAMTCLAAVSQLPLVVLLLFIL